MNSWHATYLGLKRLPRDLTAFEVEAFFTFSVAERRVIEARRGPELKLGLALQIGFLRMSGRLLDALRIVPAMLWRHLGEQFAAAAPDLASLRAMYRRRRTLFEHQELACETLGFYWLSEPRRRALVRVLRDELARTTDRQRLLQFARRWLYEHQLIVLRERDLRTMIAKAIRSHEAALARGIHDALDPLLLAQWRATITRDQEKTGAIPTSHRMSPASLVAEATASRAIPRSKHGLDLAYETGSAVVTWTKTKYRYPLSPRFFPVSIQNMGRSDVERRPHSWLLCQADHHRAVPPKLGHDGVALGKLGRIGPRQPPLDLGGVEPPRRRHDPAKRQVR
jgi:hypothetical protein